MESKLTPKQQRFVQECLVDRNATQAAIRAGYSAKTARATACENLTKQNIQEEIQRLMRPIEKKLEISRERVMQELAAVAFANGADFAKVVQGGVYVTPTDELPAGKLPAIAGIKENANGIEVKLHDKVRALELLGKATGAFDNTVTAVQESNLFDAIVGSAGGELNTDDIPEIKQEAAVGNDMVESSTV